MFRTGVACVLAACPFIAGCGGETGPRAGEGAREPTRRTFNPDEAAELFAAAAAGTDEEARRDAWTIVLVTFSGEDQAADAALVRAALSDAGFVGVREERRRDNTLLAFGAYPDPDDGAAQRDLARARAIEIDGRRPFASAFLAPPDAAAGSGRTPEYDLRFARALHDPSALYTLEVAVYARADRERPTAEELAQFRAAAEEAVRTLRAEGEAAFFYHGPNRSSVTIGLFGADDHDPETPQLESTRLRLVRDRHPTLLLNGAGVRETIRTSAGRTTRLRPTYLVAVPEPE